MKKEKINKVSYKEVRKCRTLDEFCVEECENESKRIKRKHGRSRNGADNN